MEDVLTIRSNAAREAFGYQTQSSNFAAQAQLDRQQAGFAQQAGDIGVMSSLLGGTSTAANDAYNFNRYGAFRSSGASNVLPVDVEASPY